MKDILRFENHDELLGKLERGNEQPRLELYWKQRILPVRGLVFLCDKLVDRTQLRVFLRWFSTDSAKTMVLSVFVFFNDTAFLEITELYH